MITLITTRASHPLHISRGEEKEEKEEEQQEEE